jgi:hypothetical protein
MSYDEKSAWTYLLTSLLVWVGYVVVLLTRTGGGSLAEVPYVSALLWAVGISILANTILRALFEAVRPSDSRMSDERDRAIDRRGEYVAGIVLAVAVVGPFVLALTESPHFWIANAIYAAYTLSAVVGSAVKVVGYRRGF